MADMLVNGAKLDACLDAEADAIRAKTGDSNSLTFDFANNKGFADAIAAIPSGGGGSGLSLRDVTPEATRDVCEREVPGIAEAMRAHSIAITPFAMLSRALCMQRGRHIVINLPGSEKAARENWDGIVAALPHAAKMMAGEGH